jgi:hypothetical protein
MSGVRLGDRSRPARHLESPTAVGGEPTRGTVVKWVRPCARGSIWRTAGASVRKAMMRISAPDRGEQMLYRPNLPIGSAVLHHCQCLHVADPCRWRSPITDISVCGCFRAQRQALADPQQPAGAVCESRAASRSIGSIGVSIRLTLPPAPSLTPSRCSAHYPLIATLGKWPRLRYLHRPANLEGVLPKLTGRGLGDRGRCPRLHLTNAHIYRRATARWITE